MPQTLTESMLTLVVTKPNARDGKLQHMVFPDGKPKGMQDLVEERGINLSGMKADNMLRILKEMNSFKYEKTNVEEYYITAKRYRYIFIPKYHCVK